MQGIVTLIVSGITSSEEDGGAAFIFLDASLANQLIGRIVLTNPLVSANISAD